jgi:hypothetical protein
MAYGFLSNVRIAGEGMYIPAHVDTAGKQQSARAVFTVICNKKRGNSEDRFPVTFFGKLADTAARSFERGKELSLFVEMNSFRSTIFDKNTRQPIVWNGETLTKEVNGYVCRDIVIGASSNKTVAEQIAKGERPAGWNIAGSADEQTWKQKLAIDNAKVYAGGDKFGYCRVVQPKGTVTPAQPGNAPLPTGAAPQIDPAMLAQIMKLMSTASGAGMAAGATPNV